MRKRLSKRRKASHQRTHQQSCNLSPSDGGWNVQNSLIVRSGSQLGQFREGTREERGKTEEKIVRNCEERRRSAEKRANATELWEGNYEKRWNAAEKGERNQEIPRNTCNSWRRTPKTALNEAVEIAYAASLHRRIELSLNCCSAFLSREQGECAAPLHHRHSSCTSTQGTPWRK